MKARGLKTKCKDKESIIMHAELYTEDNGKTISTMERVFTSSPTELYTKANGKIIKCTEQDLTLIPMAENGKVSIEMGSLKLKSKNNFCNKSK